MEFKQVLENRRSIRKYTKQAVEKEKVDAIIEAGLLAPSAHNTQPWQFIIVRDSIVNSIKMVAGSKGHVVAAIKSGKAKTACLMVGIVLTLFYNLPFELWNLKVSDFLLIVACVLSIISGVQYYNLNKKFFLEDARK